MATERLLAVLARGRAMAEARMTSRCSIHRFDPANPSTNADGMEVDGYALVHTGVPFRLAGSERGGSGSRTVRVGESEVQVALRVGHLPAAVSDLADDDLIVVTAGENAGTVLRIVEATWADQQTARRVPVVEIDRPEGLA